MEKYLLVLWLNEDAIIDGAYYFDTREDALNYWESLPKIARVSENVEITYTICRIVKHEPNKSE
jgi:hypothetical protein